MTLYGGRGNDLALRRSEAVISVVVDGEAVLLDCRQGTYFGFDAIGTKIWNILSQPTTTSAVVDKLLQEYDVDEQTCLGDTVRFLESLMRKNLVDTVNA